MELFLKYIFPIFGLFLILCSVSFFFFPFGQKIRESIQHFEGFGLKLDISVTTLIILIGVIFSGIGLFLNQFNYKNKFLDEKSVISQQLEKIDSLNSAVNTLNDRINFFKRQTITYQIYLNEEKNEGNQIDIRSIKCVYKKNWLAIDSVEFPVTAGIGPNTIKVTFDNISGEDLMDASPQITIKDLKRKKIWKSLSFNPLEPTIQLSESSSMQ